MDLADNIRTFLEEKPRFAVMATVGEDGVPHQAVMWFDLRKNTIMMNTKRGRVKLANLERNPIVSVCVEDGYRYAALYGKVAILTDPAQAQADIKSLAFKYVGPEKGQEMIQMFSKEDRISLHVTIDKVQSMGV